MFYIFNTKLWQNQEVVKKFGFGAPALWFYYGFSSTAIFFQGYIYLFNVYYVPDTVTSMLEIIIHLYP